MSLPIRRIDGEHALDQDLAVLGQEGGDLVVAAQDLLVQTLRVAIVERQFPTDRRIEDYTTSPDVAQKA